MKYTGEKVMKNVIYKYTAHWIPGIAHLVFDPIPLGAQILTHGLDAVGKPCIWCQVEDPAQKQVESCDFIVIMTGSEVPEGYTHVETFVDTKNGLVMHFYQRNKLILFSSHQEAA